MDPERRARALLKQRLLGTGEKELSSSLERHVAGMLWQMKSTIAAEASESDPTVLDLCCGGRRCPVLRDEGDTIVISDSEQTSDSIRFSKVDAERIVRWMQTRLGK